MTPDAPHPVRTQRAAVVRFAALSVLIASVLHIVISTFAVESAAFNFATSVTGVIVCLGCLALLRAGRVDEATWLLVATLFGIAVAATLFGGGSRSPAYDVYFVTIFLGGFMLGSRAAIVLGIASILATAGIAWVESAGMLPDPQYPLTASMRWLTLFAALTAASGSLWLGLRQTERNLEAVRRSEERFRLVTEHASDFVWTLDPKRVFTFASPSIEGLLGYSADELIGHPWRQEMLAEGSPEIAPIVQAAIAERREFMRYEAQHLRKDGTAVWCEVTHKLLYDDEGRLSGVNGITRDISERKAAEARERALERQFQESQRLESIGKLAGGIAHDFNNYLTVIIGNSEMLAMDAPPEMAQELEEISDAADRSADLTRQLLAFSRKQILSPVVLDLNETIRAADRLLNRILGEDVSLQTICAAGLGRVQADPTQVQQIILNLAVNARSAMPAGGHLTIETGNVVLDAEYTAKHPEVEPGPYVMLAVSDTGVGMAPDVVGRIFEPFFTTRSKGSGLGLATVHGIVKQSGGSILVYSEVGEGTTFKIYLPRIDETAADPVAHLSEGLDRGTRGTGRVLLVEDLDMLRGMIQRILEESGFAVVSAGSAEQALELVESEGEPFDLLVTDVVLPGQNGVELSRALTERFELPVLFISGFTENGVVHRGILDPGVLLLQKPFTAAQLLDRVHDALARPADSDD